MPHDSSPPPRDSLGWVGQLLDGKYRIDEVIGEGGYGIVYAGHHLGFDEPIAIKFLKLDVDIGGARRERFLKQFLAEGKHLFRLSQASAAIVRAIDVGAAVSPKGKWAPYLVLEWVRGQTLEKDILGRISAGLGGRPLQDAVALLTPGARALDTAHEEGVTHRDVKPANFIVTDVRGKPTLKVFDFGIAKVVHGVRDQSAGTTTKSPSLHAFTPSHAAPEQFEKHFGSTGPWTDVFALALVLVEVVSAKRGLFGNSPADHYMAATDPARRPTLRAHGVACSDEVERVLQRALAIDPRNRFQRAGDFWNALVAATNAEPSTVVVAAPRSALDTTPGTQPDITEIPEVPITVPRASSHAAIAPVSHTVDDPIRGDAGGVARVAPKGRRRGRGLMALLFATGVGAALASALVRTISQQEPAAVPSAVVPPASGAPPSPSVPATVQTTGAATAAVADAGPPAIAPSPTTRPAKPASLRDPRCARQSSPGNLACESWTDDGRTIWCGECEPSQHCFQGVCRPN
jgi:serine/threonine-protein kinase